MTENNIYWIKRDFRLADNKAFDLALKNDNAHCTPIFILSKSFLLADETSGFHKLAINDALKDLKKNITNKRGELAYAIGDVLATFQRLHELLPINNIFAHEEIGTERTFKIDLSIRSWCRTNNVNFVELPQTGVFRGMNDRDNRNKLWKKFYSEKPVAVHQDLSRCKIPDNYKSLLSSFSEVSRSLNDTLLSSTQRKLKQEVSESAAWETLNSFLYERGIDYSGGISSPLSAFQAGSRLSVHLAWGTITGRLVYEQLNKRIEELKALKEKGDTGADKWLKSLRAFSSRLHWRDHFIQRLESEPDMEHHALNAAYNSLDYDNNDRYLEAWITGTTGYPMVDACIRCLRETGFINFRMRAMLTSFACHSLSLDWKLIDKPMARLYTDYEPGIHLSQLQMQAGVVGINTVRIYSPDKQLLDHDPDTVFVKKWIPELKDFSTETIKAHGADPLKDYPGKIVDWKETSSIMRNRIFAIKRTDEHKVIAAQVFKKHGSRKQTRKNTKSRKA